MAKTYGKPNGGLAVICCGCRRMFGVDGRPASCDDSGRVDCALFSSVEDAHAACVDAGWQARDDRGPNHRCPDCLAGRSKMDPSRVVGHILDQRYNSGLSERGRGAIVSRAELFGDQG